MTYNLTYDSLHGLVQTENFATHGLMAHGFVWGLFVVIFISLIGKMGLGRALLIAGLSGFIFSIILVGLGIGSPSDMAIMMILTIVGVFI